MKNRKIFFVADFVSMNKYFNINYVSLKYVSTLKTTLLFLSSPIKSYQKRTRFCLAVFAFLFYFCLLLLVFIVSYREFVGSEVILNLCSKRVK